MVELLQKVEANLKQLTTNENNALTIGGLTAFGWKLDDDDVDSGKYHRDGTSVCKRETGAIVFKSFAKHEYELRLCPMPVGYADTYPAQKGKWEQSEPFGGVKPIVVTIPPGSCYVMGGSVRNAWLHKPHYKGAKPGVRIGVNIAPHVGPWVGCMQLLLSLFR